MWLLLLSCISCLSIGFLVGRYTARNSPAPIIITRQREEIDDIGEFMTYVERLVRRILPLVTYWIEGPITTEKKTIKSQIVIEDVSDEKKE
jgi:hypothetical protein